MRFSCNKYVQFVNIIIKASFTLSRFSVPAANTALNLDTPCKTGVHRDVVPVVSFFLHNRDAPRCDTTPAYSVASP